MDKLKQHQFKPGQSGNPGGRPKVAAEIQKLAGKNYSKLIKLWWVVAHGSDQAVDRFFGAHVRRTLRDRLDANRELMDRAVGRPGQSVLLGSDPENPATLPEIHNHFAAPTSESGKKS